MTAAGVSRFAPGRLHEFAAAVLATYGTPAAAAVVVAETLVEADRRGVASHGLVRLESYCKQVEAGEIDVSAEPAVEASGGPTARVDGRRAFGALTAVLAIDEAVTRAEWFGVGAVTTRRAHHFGTAAFYALRAARAGYVGVAATNTPAVMAAAGAAEAVIGNNPLALAAPLPDDRPPFVFDMALTHVARGRVKLAEIGREPIPDGWALGPNGQPTTDPGQALVGALLPIAGYKGSGLALAIEVLTGVLSGGGLSPELQNTSMTGAPQRLGAQVGTVSGFYLVLNPDRFVGRAEFAQRLARLFAAVKHARTSPGVDEVLIPGELEDRAAADADANGIPLAASTIKSLTALGRRLGVPFEEAT